MKNAYANKLSAVRENHDRSLVRQSVQRTLDMVTIALNEDFNFGPTRLSRLANRVNELFGEFTDLAESGDHVYADQKVQERLKRIMGG